jgi:ribosome-binding factor A
MAGRGRYPRTARVNQVLQEVVADALERMGTDDERLQLVTITGVEVDRDLRHAKVFYAARHEEAATALEERRIALQRTIARETRLRHTPQLSFLADPAIASGWRVEEILKDLSERDETIDGDDTSSP